jgi:pimeloyl-ACP methyl ester carboxylesterase
MLGHSPGDYAAEQEALAERRRLARHPPPLPRGLRRLEAAACTAMALGLVNPWAALAGPFSPKLYPLDTVLGGAFGVIVAVTVALVFHEITRGAGRATRVVLLVLAAVLVALAVDAVVDPPVAGGARVVGVGVGWWLCPAGSLALLAAALLALRRPETAWGPRSELVAGRPEASVVATRSQGHLSVPVPVLAGHANGGLFTQLDASTHPRQVAGLVLIDTVHSDHHQRRLAMLKPLVPPEVWQARERDPPQRPPPDPVRAITPGPTSSMPAPAPGPACRQHLCHRVPGRHHHPVSLRWLGGAHVRGGDSRDDAVLSGGISWSW